MAVAEEIMQQMRCMQDDISRLMRTCGARQSMFGFDRDPFVSALTYPSDNFSRELAIPQTSTAMGSFRPHMDVLDMGDHFSVRADIPGIQKQDVKVEVKNGMLSISAEHKEDKKRKEGNWVLQERRFGKFQRTLKLPENVKEDAIKARFNEGVLELDLPKQEKCVAKSITVS